MGFIDEISEKLSEDDPDDDPENDPEDDPENNPDDDPENDPEDDPEDNPDDDPENDPEDDSQEYVLKNIKQYFDMRESLLKSTHQMTDVSKRRKKNVQNKAKCIQFFDRFYS